MASLKRILKFFYVKRATTSAKVARFFFFKSQTFLSFIVGKIYSVYPVNIRNVIALTG